MASTPPQDGLHWAEWGSEFAGTALLMLAVVSAKYLAVRAGRPYADLWPRIVIVAVVAGAAVVAVAVSPLGRRSGAHLNPAVTLGLWWQGIVSRADVAGYVIAQVAGGVCGFAAGAVWGIGVRRPPVSWAVIAPSINEVVSTLVEAAATAAQLGLVFWLLSDGRRVRWAAPVGGTVLAVAIIGLATTSGAGFNPVRGLAPDVVAGTYPGLWTFIVGPLIGAATAGAVFRATSARRPVTGKLRHDAQLTCYLGCELPHAPARRLTSIAARPA